MIIVDWEYSSFFGTVAGLLVWSDFLDLLIGPAIKKLIAITNNLVSTHNGNRSKIGRIVSDLGHSEGVLINNDISKWSGNIGFSIAESDVVDDFRLRKHNILDSTDVVDLTLLVDDVDVAIIVGNEKKALVDAVVNLLYVIAINVSKSIDRPAVLSNLVIVEEASAREIINTSSGIDTVNNVVNYKIRVYFPLPRTNLSTSD